MGKRASWGTLGVIYGVQLTPIMVTAITAGWISDREKSSKFKDYVLTATFTCLLANQVFSVSVSLRRTISAGGSQRPQRLCMWRTAYVEAYCLCVETTRRRPFMWRLVIVQSGSTVQDEARFHRRGGRQLSLSLSLVNCVGPEKQGFWTLSVCFVYHGSHFPHNLLFFFHASQRYIHQQKVRRPL